MLVFNSIGWKPSNILFNAVDALLGDPLISSAFNGEQPAHAQAYIRDTPVDAGGAVTVTAVSAAQLNAVAGNENVVEAAVDLLFTRAGQKGDAKSTEQVEEARRLRRQRRSPAAASSPRTRSRASRRRSSSSRPRAAS